MIESILTAIVFLVVGVFLCFWICSKSICPVMKDESVIGAAVRCPNCGKCIPYEDQEVSVNGSVTCTRCSERVEIAPIRQCVP